MNNPFKAIACIREYSTENITRIVLSKEDRDRQTDTQVDGEIDGGWQKEREREKRAIGRLSGDTASEYSYP